ncbi:glycosyltransferase family 4 protein [Bogoriella caseilytica]|uniref:Glycosyl transferase family 1 n=1 Tax=Bogoriella caseilytica TaxID=56055 RepID=A0A3N2BD69_9MICO|nr:glycosyltransferase family 4 protein [Bogoriella caseilytica]ROR73182.1 glycosyl transferase family 1 [Bogoriella caseilytica]
MSATAFLTWDSQRPSGGNTYNAELIGALRAAGEEVEVYRVPGSWPAPQAAARERAAQILNRGAVAIVDGIVASGVPEAIDQAVDAGRRVVVLAHMAAADEHGLSEAERARREDREGRAFRAASAVVATSKTAARDLERRHRLTQVHVALPGMRAQPPAAGSDPPRILAVGAVTPTKDHRTLLRALSHLSELHWSARIVGSDDLDPALTGELAAMIRHEGWSDRVRLTGALTGEPLEVQWCAADLLVLPSRHETYGLVVLEALAHGIPAVVTDTGAAEALAVGGPGRPLPGVVVPVGDASALADRLRAWASADGLRTAWRRRAGAVREMLPSWEQTARSVRRII